MKKNERLQAAIEGRNADRPPVTAWGHFLSDFLPGPQTAQRHLEFQRAYDWDIVKVMSDYSYPVPPGVETLEDPRALEAYRQTPDLDAPCFAEQLSCLATLRRELGPDVPVLDTLFDPYQQILRNVGRDQESALWAGGQRALDALDAVCSAMCRYVVAARRAGADGFFYSVSGAIREGQPRGVSREVYERFQRPFNLRLLEAASGSIRVLHVHGVGLDFERIMGYPAEVLSWSDRRPGNPTLSEVRARTSRCLMGGLHEVEFYDRSRPALARQIDDAIAQMSGAGFILAPGCTLPSSTPVRLLKYLRDYTQGESA